MKKDLPKHGRTSARPWKRPTRVTSSGNMSLVSTSASRCSTTASWILVNDFGEPAAPSLSTKALRMAQTGLNISVLERGELLPVQEEDVGFFHEGNCYVVTWNNPNDLRDRSVHYWTGGVTCQNERDAVEVEVNDIETTIGSFPMLTKEFQGKETTTFLRLFPTGICYLEGKRRSRLSKCCEYKKRLYRIEGCKYVRAHCMQPCIQNLDSSYAFFLDNFPRMYLWYGADASYALKTKALTLCLQMRDTQRAGLAHIVVVEETNAELHASFLTKLTNHLNCERLCSNSEVTTHQDGKNGPVIYRINGDSVLYDMPEIGRTSLSSNLLDSSTVCCVYHGQSSPFYIWIGENVPVQQKHMAMHRAQALLQERDLLRTTSVVRIDEGHEQHTFKSLFHTWHDKIQKREAMLKSYSAGTIGRALFSRSDRRTVAKTANLLSQDSISESREDGGSLKMWLFDGASLTALSSSCYGTFYNGHCYIVLHCSGGQKELKTLYCWMGDCSSYDHMVSTENLCLALAKECNFEIEIVRVLDGKEPAHFLAALNGRLIVHTGHEFSSSSTSSLEQERPRVFVVHQVLGGMRIVETLPTAESLDSRKAIIILPIMHTNISFLWYGQSSGSQEREMAKNISNVISPQRNPKFEIILERKEPDHFWMLLGGKCHYQAKSEKKALDRRPASLHLFQCGTNSFHEISDFTFEDLAEDAIVLLDTFDQIYVHCGASITLEGFADVFAITRTYVSVDPAARRYNDLHIYVIKQHFEPMAFKKLVPDWGFKRNHGKSKLDMLRKAVRQENAQIHLDEVCEIFTPSRKKYSYRCLVKDSETLPELDNDHKERHLKDSDFQQRLHVSRDVFYKYPDWKRDQIRRSIRLL